MEGSTECTGNVSRTASSSKMAGSCGLFHADRGEDNTDGVTVRGVESTLPSKLLSDEMDGLEKSKDRPWNAGLRGASEVLLRHRRDMPLDTVEDRKG